MTEAQGPVYPVLCTSRGVPGLNARSRAEPGGKSAGAAVLSRSILLLPRRHQDKREPFGVQASNSGRQHYLRAVFTRAGVYEIAVFVTDPVTGEALQIPSHGSSQRLRITPGPLNPARTQIADLPSVLTAGDIGRPPLPAHARLCFTSVLDVPCSS